MNAGTSAGLVTTALGATGAGGGGYRNGWAARSKQSLDFVFRHVLLVEVNELIGRKVVKRPGVSDVGEDHLFAQAGFDELDDILNARREAWERLGRADDGRDLQNQAGYQTGNCEVMVKFDHVICPKCPLPR